MITITVLKNPFNHHDKEIHVCEYIPGKAAYEYVRPYIMGLDDYVISINGNIAEDAQEKIVNSGDWIAVCPVVGKSSWFRTIFSLALGYYTGRFFNKIAGFNKFWSHMASGVVNMIGGALINHWFPPAKPDRPKVNPSYDWNNAQSPTGQGNALGVTYGTMRTAGQVLAQHVSSNGENQYLNILLCGGEGPVDNIGDIRINDNPLSYYKDVIAETRLGENDQSIIANFNDTYIDQALAYELATDHSWATQQTQGDAIEGLEVTLQFPYGLYRIKDNGGLENASVTVELQYRKVGDADWRNFTDGNSWTITQNPHGLLKMISVNSAAPAETWTITYVAAVQTGYNTYIPAYFTVAGSVSGVQPNARISENYNNGLIAFNVRGHGGYYGQPSLANGTTFKIDVNPNINLAISAAKNTAFQSTYRIDHLSPAQYEVRARCVSKSGTDTRYSTRVFWTQLSSIIYDDFLRPGKALVGIRALATNQLSGGMPSITWIQNRDNVWVWNADSGQYEEKPATNPAWAAYDMIHRCRQIKNIHTGNFEFVVRGAPASRTIYQDFAHWAAFCDSRNLTFDYIYDTATDLWTALQKPEGVGRGKVIMRGTRFGCVCDAPGQPVQLFTVGNMITDQFSETFVGLKDRANAIEITFLNKDKGYQKDVITAYADDYDFVTEPNITQITLDGATTVAQAYREGKYRLRLNQYLRRTVNHSADIDAIACQINDVVLLAHDVPQWGFSGRLLDATATTLQFDRQVTLKPNTAYAVALQITDPAAETPQAAQSIVTLSVQGVEQEICTDTVTIAGSLSTVPQKWDLYSFGETNKVVKPFRVLDISRDQDLRRKITCLEYIEEIYHEATDVPEINYSALDTTPAEVAGVSAAEETYRQKDGTIVSNLNVAWMMARNDKMIIGYEVSYSVDDGDTWTIWATGISALNASIIGVKTNTTYLVKVSTINEAGVVSPGSISAPLLITGKDAPPSDVAEITATIDPANCTKIRLSWSGVNDIDLSGYCLWESGGIITATPITDTQYVYTATTSRQHSFSVVAVDNSGNISPIPATISLTVTVEPAQVTGFTATTQATDRSKLALSWQANTETDISYYEIRQGDRWDTGTVIATQLKATNYTVQLTTEGNQIYWIKAFNAAGNSSTLAVSQAVQVVLKPDTPANLAVAQDPKDRSIAVISWTASPGQDISGYELRCGDSWSTGMEIATVKDTLYKYTLPASGTYNFMVRAKTVAGYLSNVANHPAFSPSIEPDIVTGFTATQSISDRTQVTLSWATPSELDVAYFVIKQGPSWDEGTIIGQRVTGTYYNVRVTTEEEQTFWITAVSVAGVYSQSPVKISGIFSLNPDPVTNIQIAQQTGDKSVVDITWTGITESDLTGYQVKVGLAWDTGEALLLTKELKTTYTPGTSGTLKAMVKAVNAAGFYSDEAYATAPITLEPLDVTGLVAYQNGETIELYWDQAVEPDVVAYEIREGASSEQGQLMATGVTENKYVVNVDTEKNYRYFVKAINRSGHYSVYAAAASVNVANLPAKNVIESFDEILLRTGTATNCEFGSSLINFSNLGGRFPDYPTTRFSDVGGAQVLKLKATNGVYPDSGTYACARKDMGQIITANITVQFVSTVVLKGAGSAVLQIRTSQDGTNFTDWTTFKPAQYTFRYADFQVLLGTADTTKTPEVNQLLIKIDVPDIDIAKTATIAVGGTAVDYGHAFYTTPTVTPTALGEDLHAQVISKTASSCIIKIKNASNTDVGGQADVLIRGY